jgi:hypothetical protein
MITNIDALSEICSLNKEIIIYGAGLVAHTLISYIYKKELKIKIFCILVSSMEGNPEHILGIPVCVASELPESEKNKKVIVATLVNNHKPIGNLLRRNEINNVEYMSNIAYAQMRRTVSDYGADVYDYVKRMQKNTQKGIDELYKKLNKIESCIRYHVSNYDECLSEEEYPDSLIEWYFRLTGEILDLNNPYKYTEKIQWLKLNDNSRLKAELTDKYAVRNWVEEKIGKEYLITLLGVWESFDEIDFKQLPKKFILKCNHGCGYNLIVKDKTYLNLPAEKRKFDMWMKENFAMIGGLQLQYDGITPVIIAEEYLENGNQDLYDYKVWCFNGKAYYIMFLADRKTELKMAFYDCKWNKVNISYDHPIYEKEVERPKQLERLLSLAETLSQGFCHVRVDFYILNDGNIKFGEMTFSPASGGMRWNPPEINDYFGELLRIPGLEVGNGEVI